MKFPKIGQVVFAAQSDDLRIGETVFLCSTQENCELSIQKVKKEMQELIDDEDLEEGTKYIIWEMRRVE